MKRTQIQTPEPDRDLVAEAVGGVAVLVGFFAVLVTIAHPFIVAAFLTGLLTAGVATVGVVVLSRHRTVYIPGTTVSVRADSR